MQQNETFSTRQVDQGPSAAAGQVKELARAGTEQAKQLGKTTRERAMREIDARREGLAGEVEKLAGALENQSGQGKEAGPVLEFAASAARRLSGALRDNSAEQLLQGMARNPVAILGGTFALGFFVTRLFKA